MKKVPMTRVGFKQLQAKLEQLKVHERPKVIAAIAEACAHGDLKENAEYHAAKERQGFIEGQMVELENKLALSDIIDPSKVANNGRVIFGATLHLVDINSQETVIYQIVGEDEADIKQGKLSVTSPIAREAIGKKVGDSVVVKTPAGLREFRIIQIEYIA